MQPCKIISQNLDLFAMGFLLSDVSQYILSESEFEFSREHYVVLHIFYTIDWQKWPHL